MSCFHDKDVSSLKPKEKIAFIKRVVDIAVFNEGMSDEALLIQLYALLTEYGLIK